MTKAAKKKRQDQMAESLADIIGEHLATLAPKQRKIIILKAQRRLLKRLKASSCDDPRPTPLEREQAVPIRLVARSPR